MQISPSRKVSQFANFPDLKRISELSLPSFPTESIREVTNLTRNPSTNAVQRRRYANELNLWLLVFVVANQTNYLSWLLEFRTMWFCASGNRFFSVFGNNNMWLMCYSNCEYSVQRKSGQIEIRFYCSWVVMESQPVKKVVFICIIWSFPVSIDSLILHWRNKWTPELYGW